MKMNNDITKSVEIDTNTDNNADNNQEQFLQKLAAYKKYKWIISGIFAIVLAALLVADVFTGWGKLLFVGVSVISWLAFVIGG